MAYSFKLSRRIARLRAPACAALIAALAACDSSESLDPNSGIIPDAADQSGITEVTVEDAVDAAAVGEPTLASISFAGGIPIGMAAQPLSLFGSRFNGAKLTIGANQLLGQLSTIRSRGGRIVLMMAGNPRYYKDGSGHFDLAKWKARVDEFKRIDFASYVKDGTVIGHFLMDEPNDPRNWNDRPVPPSMIEEMAKYSKQLWPDLPTIVRVEPSYLGSDHQYLDGAWAQYLARRGNVNDYLKRSVTDAQQRGLSLVVGLNVIDGGEPNGTPMSGSEVEAWGSALLSSSYPCAFIMWQHNSTYLSTSGIGSAMEALRRKAESRSSRSCRG